MCMHIYKRKNYFMKLVHTVMGGGKSAKQAVRLETQEELLYYIHDRIPVPERVVALEAFD